MLKAKEVLPVTDGERIKAARKKAGMTQKELADKLGIPYQGISQYERGIRNPKIATMKKIAIALNIPPSQLISEDVLFRYEEYEDLAHDIKQELISDAGSPEEYEEAITKTTDIQEDLVRSYYKNERLKFVETAFNWLNPKGQRKVIRYIQEIIKDPQYRNNAESKNGDK